MSVTHDFVAVGIGPFNLGLACLTDPVDELDGVFLERADGFDWHPGMMLETSTLQTPFLADLVTLADPTSRFSFLNYVKQSGHLYSFYIRESFHPLRSEYNDYCRWAAAALSSLRFGRDVQSIEYDARDDSYLVHAAVGPGRDRETYRARCLVLGTGSAPMVPDACRGLAPGVVHSSQYLPARERLQAGRSIAVVGGGQSAAEIFLDLLEDVDRHDYALTWVTRSARFLPLEYTKLTLEMTSPEYVEYFHRLPPPQRDELIASQGQLYKGIDAALIDDIFRLLYRRHRQGRPDTTLLTNTELTSAAFDEDAARFELGLRHIEQDSAFTLAADGVVLATGYRQEVPAFLQPIADRIAWDDRGRFAVRRNYGVDRDGRGTIFVQNAELHTHGFVAPDLGMAAYRNSCIIRELLGREHYPIERTIAFQEFGAPCPPPAVVFERADEELGTFALRPVDPEADAALLHGWITHGKASFWPTPGTGEVGDVAAEYREIAESPWHDAFVGMHDGRPSFLVERYHPAHEEIADSYALREGDVGMHFLVAPAGEPRHGFTRAVIETVMAFLFTDPEVQRVVVEPDVCNRAVHRLNAAVGFRVVGAVALSYKEALLSTCTRAQHEQATRPRERAR